MKWNKYSYNLDVFYNEDDISYYLLGAYMTDGNIWSSKIRPSTKSVRLVSKDIDWLNTIRNLICPNKPIVDKNGCGSLEIYNSELANWFIAKGCTANKSLDLKFPIVPEQYLPDFIRGCIDGDGSISMHLDKKKNNYTYGVTLTTASEDFCDQIISILNVQFNCSKSKCFQKPHLMKNGKTFTPKHPYYVLKLSGSNAIEFLKWIYYPSHKLSMPRKNNLSNKLIETHSKYASRRIHLI